MVRLKVGMRPSCTWYIEMMMRSLGTMRIRLDVIMRYTERTRPIRLVMHEISHCTITTTRHGVLMHT